MIEDAFRDAVDDALNDRLRDPKQKAFVVSTLMDGFSRLPQKPVPDVAKRLETLQNRMRLMLENVSLAYVNGRLVVKVAGSSESLMIELRRGTSWYAPWDKVDETLLAAILVDPET